MILTVHAGHNPDGMIASGAVGFVKESTVAREIKNEVMRLLSLCDDVKAYDITVDNGASQSNILTRLVNAANEVKADLNLSIHLNSGINQANSDGKTTGCECWIYPGSKSREAAEAICDALHTYGYKNRGVKESSSLYFLKKTKKPSIIIEVCFVDDPDDVAIIDSKAIARAIVRAVVGRLPYDVQDQATDAEASSMDSDSISTSGIYYRVQVGAYRSKDNAKEMQKKLQNAGFDAVIVR